MDRERQGNRSFLDGTGARLCALAVLVCAVAVIAWHHRDDLFPPPPKPQAELNPDFVKCRDERTSQVDRMRDEGVINDDQHEQFAARAIAFCTGQFPPEKP